MPRIPEALIESIKRDVGCVAVLDGPTKGQASS